jgi:hypothetical protein
VDVVSWALEDLELQTKLHKDMRKGGVRSTHQQYISEGLAQDVILLSARLGHAGMALQAFKLLKSTLKQLPCPPVGERGDRLCTITGTRVPLPSTFHAVIQTCAGSLRLHYKASCHDPRLYLFFFCACIIALSGTLA